MVRINGEEKNAAGENILEYLQHNGYENKYVAVECNGEIISKAQYESYILCDGDVIEVVSFVGGG